MASHRTLTNSPFDTLEKTFKLLVKGTNPLAFDGTRIAGIPSRLIPFDELQAMLLHPSTSFDVRDAVIGALVAQSQREGGAATIALAGVLLPGLRRAGWALIKSCPGKTDDIEAEMLLAFLEAVAACDPGRARLAARLTWLARTGGSRLLRTEMAERAEVGTDPVSSAPPRPYGHADLVLAHAVGVGVISARDAELIGATRIGDVDLAYVARCQGVEYDALQKRRVRAETSLAVWLTSEEYVPFDFVRKEAQTPCSIGGGRNRQVQSKDRRPENRRSAPTNRR
jgi:hypothetical protein